MDGYVGGMKPGLGDCFVQSYNGKMITRQDYNALMIKYIFSLATLGKNKIMWSHNPNNCKLKAYALSKCYWLQGLKYVNEKWPKFVLLMTP